ncbi:hypothetical protein C1645_816066 [Glomus cerebriforme]|uniref:Uncharacterized protein n=1 Tax=Glomus cerebriforme TaxID=658196 RepID=A0A397THG5_9GLOM|nr:hypothetical protein C1645_816066 [Glomus cerebriforme]
MSKNIIKKIPISNLSRKLINLQTGLGAVKLGPEVKKISLIYSKRNDNSGARYFKKENLPRITYNNPGLPIEISVFEEKGVKPTLTIEFGILLIIDF